MYSKIDHMIGHKTSLNKFKKIEIIPSIFSDYKRLKLETNLKEKTQKHSNSWKFNSMLLNNEWVKNECQDGWSRTKWQLNYNPEKIADVKPGSQN